MRFLGEFDNLLLAHQDRTRFVPTEVRKAVYLPGLRVAATVLVDGVVAATWTMAREKKTARLVVTPLAKLSAYDRARSKQKPKRWCASPSPKRRRTRCSSSPLE